MSVLAVARDHPVTHARINRPEKANALDAELVEALLETVSACATDGTRLLVIDGEDRNFSAGFDFSGFELASQGDLLHRFVRIEQLLQALYHAPFATVAFAHGRNFGAGADLFLACSIRVASADATFRMPGLRFGLQLGTRRLAQRIGNDPARALLGESRTLTAAEALNLGFATRVAARETWTDILADEGRGAIALSAEAAARLHAATVIDTRAEDMADLVASVTVPGLRERIRAYRERG